MTADLTDDGHFAREPGHPPTFDRARFGVAQALGGRLGVSAYLLQPGEAVCPYHYELGDEELLVVLGGTPTLRTEDGETTLEPGALVWFEAGPTGAHQVRNDSEAPSRVLLAANHALVGVAVYPDSDKLGAFGPGTDVLFRRADAVDYFEGEPPG